MHDISPTADEVGAGARGTPTARSRRGVRFTPRARASITSSSKAIATAFPNGLETFRDRLVRRSPPTVGDPLLFPGDPRARPRARFACGEDLGREVVTAPPDSNLLRYRTSTLKALRRSALPPRLQAVLAGQSGDYVSCRPKRSAPPPVGSCAPTIGGATNRGAFPSFIGSVARHDRERRPDAGSPRHEVERILVERGRAPACGTSRRETDHRSRYISNVIRAARPPSVARARAPKGLSVEARLRLLSGTITLYRGVRASIFATHGFG